MFRMFFASYYKKIKSRKSITRFRGRVFITMLINEVLEKISVSISYFKYSFFYGKLRVLMSAYSAHENGTQKIWK